ncbi:hypothetical protein BDN72DRAFT_633022 [Pluteus cervinus]|uniref:Uncharacterized protein n=1 Tax=Pluteus cervinus TaxID=181527 RepID=A0ACD3BAY2_9AGAR|nr:hypothetical protein BDN72DRAFT_633022 [Pluteus cervinus]
MWSNLSLWRRILLSVPALQKFVDVDDDFESLSCQRGRVRRATSTSTIRSSLSGLQLCCLTLDGTRASVPISRRVILTLWHSFEISSNQSTSLKLLQGFEFILADRAVSSLYRRIHPGCFGTRFSERPAGAQRSEMDHLFPLLLFPRLCSLRIPRHVGCTPLSILHIRNVSGHQRFSIHRFGLQLRGKVLNSKSYPSMNGTGGFSISRSS